RRELRWARGGAPARIRRGWFARAGRSAASLSRRIVTGVRMGKHRLGRLLLVEDEHRLRALVAQVLEGEGYAVVEAVDGPEGVERHRDSGPFDLALVDL